MLVITLFLITLVTSSGCGVKFKNEFLDDAASDAAPADYISLRNGSNSIVLRSSLGSQTGFTYGVVYNADPGVLTAAQVKADALAGVGGARVAVLTVTHVAANTLNTSNLATGLTQTGGATYFVAAVHEGNSTGLYADSAVKRYTNVIPQKLSMQQYIIGTDSPNFAPYTAAAAVDKKVYYALHLPDGYYDNPTQTFPVILYLHGWGGRTTDTGVHAEAGFNNLVSGYDVFLENFKGTTTDVPAIVVAPQCHDIAGANCWAFQNNSWMDEFMETVVPARYGTRINSNKVYVTGISSGGAGTVSYARRKANLLAAIIPYSSTAVYAADITGICNIATNNVATWLLHAQNDSVSNINGVRSSQDIFDALDLCPGTHFRKMTTLWPGVVPACSVYAPNCHDTTPIIFETTFPLWGVVTPETISPQLLTDLGTVGGYTHMLDWLLAQSK